MKLVILRLVIWFSTLFLLLFYAIGFLLVGRFGGMPTSSATEAVWTVGYIYGPFLAAYASYWFSSSGRERGHSAVIEKPDIWIGALSLTFAVNLIPLLYFCLYVFFGDIPIAPTYEDSFSGRSAFGFKLLLFFSGFPVAAVNYVLENKAKVEPISSVPLSAAATEN